MNGQAVDIETRTLRIERLFKAPAEKVFDAWTRQEQLSQWFGPEGATISECAVGVKEGDAWCVTMQHADEGTNTVKGVYKLIERPTRLVFTWGWLDENGVRGHETEVDVAFEKTNEGTLMTFVQTIFENTDTRDRHNEGWSSSFICLDEFLTL